MPEPLTITALAPTLNACGLFADPYDARLWNHFSRTQVLIQPADGGVIATLLGRPVALPGDEPGRSLLMVPPDQAHLAGPCRIHSQDELLAFCRERGLTPPPGPALRLPN